MDNAKYHSRLADDARTPTTSWNKGPIIEWMRTNKVVPSQLLPGYLTPEQHQAQRDKNYAENTPSVPYVVPPLVCDSV